MVHHQLASAVISLPCTTGEQSEMLGMTEEDRKRLLRGNSGGGSETTGIAAKWWPIGESDLRYGVSPSTMRRFVAEGLVEARKAGSRTLVNDDSAGRCIAALPPAVIKPDDRSAKLARRVA
jgi:hypothetical protein